MSNQLVKRNPVEGYKNVFPKTFIDAIKDRESGASLEEIIQGFNMYFLSYNGSVALTRCKVPKALRKEGLWITYVLYDHTVVTEWYNSDNIDDESWGSDSNWRIASNALVGDISISTDGYWIINGATTNIKAQGETGITPLLRMGDNNKIQVTYDEGKNWEDISDYIVPKFRWNQGTGTTAGTIQISMDLGNTWKDLSNPITNNLRISKYIGINESLPASGVAEGTVYMKGPYYDENDSLNENPIYRMWVYAWKGNTLAWQDNGEFTSISAGVVQERGTSTTQVMSQDAVTRELTELESEVDDICGDVFTIDGYIDAPNGSTVLSSTRKRTDYIKVAGLSKVRVYGGSNEYGVALCAFYAEDMSFLNSIVGNAYNKTEIEIDVPSDAYYIRCSSDENGVGKYFGMSIAQISQEIASINNRVNEFAEEVGGIPKSLGFEDEIKTYSVLEKNGITLSVYGSPSMWDNGKIVSLSSSSYRMAINETIPVNPNETYSITTHFGDSYTKMMVHFYNSTTKQFSQADIDTSTLEFVTPSWCDTIMFTINKLYASKVLELDVLTTGKTGKLLNTKLVITEDNIQSVKLCYGKKIVLFGDSQLGQARDYPSGATNMSVLLQNIVGGKVYNWGFGGCSMALRDNADANWDAFSMVSLADAVTSGNYTNQDAAADNLKSDLPYASAILNEMKSENFADGENVIFFIAYGGNDYNNLCKLGDAASFDTKTYRGAINYSVKKLMSAFPKAKICLCGVAYRVFTYTSKTEQGITSDSDSTYNIVVENGSNQHYYRYTYNDALIEQGKQLHIPTFDKYYRAGRNRYNVWTLCPNDGVHPESLAGRTAEAEFYAAALRSL